MRKMMLVGVLFLAVSGCYGSESSEFEIFVSEYVRSVYKETDLYKQYTSSSDRKVAEASRSNMTAEFRLTGRDYAGSGIYEYGLEFSNGSTGVVTVYEEGGKVKAASIIVEPSREE